MNKFLITFTAFYCFLFGEVIAQNSTKTDSLEVKIEVELDTVKTDGKITHDFIRFVDATAYTAIAPVRWKGKDWLTMGGVFAGTAAVSLLDKPVRSFWQDHRTDSGILYGVERTGYHLGKPYAAFIMTGGFYLSGAIFRNQWVRETGIILGAAYLTSGAIQTMMKTIVGRARPGTNVGQWEFKPMSPEGDYHSFPSGHIQIAMVSAMVLAERVQNPVLKTLFYSTAGVTFLSRMQSDAHWISDLAFGGAISYFCTKAVVKRMEHNKYNNPWKKKNPVVWNVLPSYNRVTFIGTF